jgi:DivIVA domain-containing protein
VVYVALDTRLPRGTPPRPSGAARGAEACLDARAAAPERPDWDQIAGAQDTRRRYASGEEPPVRDGGAGAARLRLAVGAAALILRPWSRTTEIALTREPASVPPPPGGPARSQPVAADEIRDVSFPTAVRGYDRRQVDRYVQRVNRAIAELEVSRSPESAVRHALDRLGDPTSGILQRARETAEEITHSARLGGGDHGACQCRGERDHRAAESRGRADHRGGRQRGGGACPAGVDGA